MGETTYRRPEGGVMTDLAAPVGPPLGGQPDEVTSRANPHTLLSLILVLIGLVGGVIGFWGFFVNFFHQPNTGLYSASSIWFDLIPIFIGLGVIGLALPGGLKVFTSGLPLLSMGIVFGIHGIFGGLVSDAREPSWGYGFYMISVGSGVLTLASLSLVALWLRDRSQRSFS
jgi:hypothetical protein